MDYQEIIKGVKERIRGGILAVIPEAEWDKLIEQEARVFFCDTPTPHYSERRFEPSSFRKIVQAELEVETRKRMAVYFSRPEWDTRWNNEGTALDAVGKSLRDFVQEMAPTVVRAFFGDMLTRFIQSTRS